MDKCRFIGDLQQKDAPEILQAYPENEPVLEDENSEEIQSHNPNTSTTTRLSQDVRLMKSLPKQKVDTTSQRTNRYFFRHRS